MAFSLGRKILHNAVHCSCTLSVPQDALSIAVSSIGRNDDQGDREGRSYYTRVTSRTGFVV